MRLKRHNNGWWVEMKITNQSCTPAVEDWMQWTGPYLTRTQARGWLKYNLKAFLEMGRKMELLKSSGGQCI